MLSEISSVPLPVAIVFVFGGVLCFVRLGYVEARRRAAARAQLPQGADAALWSITEVLPDPRNHLSIKDPTSELRLTEDERRIAAEAAASARSRAERSNDRPAQRAAAEQSLSARKIALAKHEALVSEKRRRALADRDPNAFASPAVVDRLEALKVEALELDKLDQLEQLDARPLIASEGAAIGPTAVPSIDLRDRDRDLDDEGHDLHKRAAS